MSTQDVKLLLTEVLIFLVQKRYSLIIFGVVWDYSIQNQRTNNVKISLKNYKTEIKIVADLG